MKHQVYLGIALRIIILFMVGSLMTFMPDQLRNFFGDVKFVPYHDSYSDGTQFLVSRPKGSEMDHEWIWGVRHYWYHWMMVLLFLLSLINVAMSIRNLVLKHYKIN